MAVLPELEWISVDAELPPRGLDVLVAGVANAPDGARVIAVDHRDERHGSWNRFDAPEWWAFLEGQDA